MPVIHHHTGARITARVFLVVSLVACLLCGCAAVALSDYDQESVERTTGISQSILTLYQELLAIEPSERADAVTGALRERHGDIETQIRVHLLREQARANNEEGAQVAGNLLESWREFFANHLSEDETALTDATLNVERGILERHLRAAFVAEESKKLVNASPE